MTETVDIRYFDLGIAALLLFASMALTWHLQLGVHRDLIIGGIRSFLQLMVMGYVLAYIIKDGAWYWVVLALMLMLGVAVHTAVGRTREAVVNKHTIYTVAIVSGSMLVLLFIAGAVLHLRPLYDPRYVLPIAGMIIGNAMTAATLAVTRLAGDLHARRREVETALALGASAAQAVHPLRRDALRTAILPSVNALLVVGVVSLPGMMTGQIIAGQDPTQAVRYQIMVMYMITAAATLTSIISTVMVIRLAFTPAHQLREASPTSTVG
jgi:putative ABC transport system permease protein